jgi:hypothetical protein
MALEAIAVGTLDELYTFVESAVAQLRSSLTTMLSIVLGPE